MINELKLRKWRKQAKPQITLIELGASCHKVFAEVAKQEGALPNDIREDENTYFLASDPSGGLPVAASQCRWISSPRGADCFC